MGHDRGSTLIHEETHVAISVGDKIPDVTLRTMTAEGPTAVQSTEVLGTGKVVLFAVPGAFTPTCSDHHLPGFVLRADELRAKGVDTVACLSVNDAFVMGAWGQAQNAGGKVEMLADGNGEFTAAVALEMDGSGFGLGTRSQRYAAILEDGVVRELMVEPGPGLEASSVASVLAKL
jgi:peroxiredoxin